MLKSKASSGPTLAPIQVMSPVAVVTIALAWITPRPVTPPPQSLEPSQLGRAISAVDEMAHQLSQPDLPESAAVRLALELRTEAARLPPLSVGKPAAVHDLSLDIERRAGKLLEAATRHDDDAMSREAGLISTELTQLRAMVGP
jgi:hypothetical protein